MLCIKLAAGFPPLFWVASIEQQMQTQSGTKCFEKGIEIIVSPHTPLRMSIKSKLLLYIECVVIHE